MTSYKASLRVAHQRICANANQTSMASLEGCTCKPSYYTFRRDREGRSIKGERTRDRREADRALNAVQAEIDQGKVPGRVKRATLNEWAATWKQNLELQRRRPSTIRAYSRSVDAACDELGEYQLREIGNPELRRFVKTLRDGGRNDVTVAKVLRELSTCLEAAVGDELLERNPVTHFRRSFKLTVAPSEANYFSNVELAQLWQQLRAGLPKPDGTVAKVAPVYPALMRFAVATGMRVGELVALKWSDIRLADGEHGEVKVTKAWNDRDGETLPKTRKSIRTVHLTADARRVVEDWVLGVGMQDDSALVFPNHLGRHLSPANLNARILNPALEAAGIPKVGEDSPEPRSFHTFRHCYARLMLEQGQPLQWVADELGHESTATTERVYGHWAKAARQQQAAAVPAGSLPV